MLRLRKGASTDLEPVELEPLPRFPTGAASDPKSRAYEPEPSPQPNQPEPGGAPLLRWSRLPGRWRGTWVLAALAVAVAVAVGATLRLPRAGEEPIDRAAVQEIADASADAAIEDLQGAPERSAQVYDSILPSLMVIQRSGEPDAAQAGLGTGVVIEADGSILTSLHIVDGAARLDLTFSDGTRTTGRVESADPDNDIAVVMPATAPARGPRST